MMRTAVILSLAAASVVGTLSAHALTLDPNKYFAYLIVPRPSHMHAQEYVFLSRERCPSKSGAPSDAKLAMYYALQESGGCWVERNQTITVCRANAESVGNDCYTNPKNHFLSVDNLPKSANF